MNPYLQYFIGLPGYQEEAPFDASTLVLFRKRISAEMLMEVNEYLLDHRDDDRDNHTPPSFGDSNGESSYIAVRCSVTGSAKAHKRDIHRKKCRQKNLCFVQN